MTHIMSFSAASLLNYLLHREREVTWRTLALSDEECSIPPLFIEYLFSFGTGDLSIEPPAAGRKRNIQEHWPTWRPYRASARHWKDVKVLTKTTDKTLPACIFKNNQNYKFTSGTHCIDWHTIYSAVWKWSLFWRDELKIAICCKKKKKKNPMYFRMMTYHGFKIFFNPLRCV